MGEKQNVKKYWDYTQQMMMMMERYKNFWREKRTFESVWIIFPPLVALWARLTLIASRAATFTHVDPIGYL